MQSAADLTIDSMLMRRFLAALALLSIVVGALARLKGLAAGSLSADEYPRYAA